ncbi:MAG: hypothetical protein MSH11_00345 [Ruminococcus sp.]|nr:hypothetical protein [Ruminococcus sp.]
MDMKKIYVTPEIEYDDFSLNDVICANLYETPEFYAIGSNGNNAGSSGAEGGMGGATGGGTGGFDW